MKKALLWAVGLLFGMAIVFLAIGFFLPSRYEVMRSTVIDAPPGKIYPLVADPKQWKAWSAWNRRDPNMEIAYTGAPMGEGAGWEWKSKSEGNGRQTFTKADPQKGLEYTLEFPDVNMKSGGEMRFEPAGGGTKVTWTNRGDVGGNPVSRWFVLMLDRMIGPDFEQGLANLKAEAEKR